VITLVSFNSSLRRLRIVCSVITSMLDVASSNITILAFREIALQMHIIYFSPAERLLPPSSIIKLSKFSPLPSSTVVRFATTLSILAFLKSLINSESSTFFSGSRLYLKLPLNSVGSYGTIVIFCLRSFKSTLLMSTPSISIEPLSSSSRRDTVCDIVDLPAPVLPTIPTFMPCETTNDTPFNTSSVLARYLSDTDLNSILPVLGHCSGCNEP